MLKAHQKYQQIFKQDYLLWLYKQKISLSSSVGRDGIRRDKFESNLDREVKVILRKVKLRKYVFTAYKEKLISKGPHKPPRQISIPTFRDRLTQRALCDILNHVFHEFKTDLPHDYIKQIKAILGDIDERYCFLRVDIKDFYPSIDHAILLKRVRSRIRKTHILYLIRNAITTPTGKPNIPNNTEKSGVPQGLSISNILSSLYLMRVDAKYTRKSQYLRYVDDILIICKRSFATGYYEMLKKDLGSIGLECHPLEGGDPGKTNISSLSEGVDYLGYHINDRGISVRKSSYSKMFDNITKVFTRYRYRKNKEHLLFRLNLRITGCVFDNKRLGWMFFFSQTDSMSQLKRLDRFLADMCREYDIPVEAVKRFTKTYYEIRYNFDKTGYLPKFDEYTRAQKIGVLSVLIGRSQEEIGSFDALRIDDLFNERISREVTRLERDIWESIY